MVDVHTPEQRSRNMSAIKGQNTKPEIALRKSLWSKGIRYRLKSRLPGRPDLIFPSVRLAIFIDGCFWHKCPEHFRNPKTNAAFWKKKISGNVKRDIKVNQTLYKIGWTVLRIWEHEIRKDSSRVVKKITSVLRKI